MQADTVDRNIEIKALPRYVDQIIGTLARLRGMTKKDVIREALVEYVEKHQADIQRLLRVKH